MTYERTYQHLTLDAERALYGTQNAEVLHCRFAGPADGESALKECAHLRVEDCQLELRYPLWHVTDATVAHCQLTEACRAALWYDRDVRLEDCRLLGVKAVRECDATSLTRCEIKSTEFGWLNRGLRMTDCTLDSEYPFFGCRDAVMESLTMKAKYSFQYVENATIRRSNLDTKDAFWHSRNVTVEDSEIRGEYLGWYSHNLKLVRCRVIGTQPLCYADGLVLEDCEMVDADLAFERSDVRANIRGNIVSVKNPIAGSIEADRIGEIILDEYLPATASCHIRTRE